MAVLSVLLLPVSALSQNWPQGAGPNVSWKVAKGNPPIHWSVAKNEHIAWKTTLPNGGQGGITVWKDRVFLTTFEEYKPGQRLYSGDILGHCINANTGKILWSIKLHGANPSPMMYAYSDSTSWSPATDGKHVWFFNSSGTMGCWDFNGKEMWKRDFLAPGEPFNKQDEPILVGNTIIDVEPLTAEEMSDHEKRYGKAPEAPNAAHPLSFWHYLRGIDATTGKTLWIAEDATTYYCTPVMGKTASGELAILHGRGGPHDVPERPIGLSLTSLAPGKEGKTIWRWSPDSRPGAPVDGTTFQALYTMDWDAKYSYWFRNAPEESHLVIDSSSGKLLKEQSLIRNVDFTQWDPAKNAYIHHKNVNIRDMKDLSNRVTLRQGEVLHVFPNWHANLVVGGYHYFFTSTGHRRNSYAPPGQSGPSHCIGRVNVETGKVEYLEVPVSVERAPGKPDSLIYGRAVNTKTDDYMGRNVAPEDRSRTDGWQIPAFFGSPIAVNGKLYLTTMLGITYVVDANATVFNEKALLAVNDLGPSGETWSLNTPSFANGKIYHRSLKELVCITPK